MERLNDYRFSELITAGFDMLPPGMRNRLRYTHFFTGSSPIKAGLIRDYDRGNGRSYHTVCCVAYPWHQPISKINQRTTVILPVMKERGYPQRLQPYMIVHELAHVLDEILGFSHFAEPTTLYAKTNRSEAFAEAFTLWVIPGYNQYYKLLRSVDEATLTLFRRLEVQEDEYANTEASTLCTGYN